MRGLPGSGKSTYVKENFPDAVVCSADSFFLNEDGEYIFVNWKLQQAHQHCFRTFIDAVTSDAETIVIDNTNICRWEYENYVFMAEKFGYRIRKIRMNFAESDIPLFGKRNIHGVPELKINQMFERFEDDTDEEIRG
tara:strand:+ start:1379 stop:1789 length:411 start_codon:yes stop_codon:yes gene_type:complete